jgi:glycosyltransferase involved in cell wall biosynthesis
MFSVNSVSPAEIRLIHEKMRSKFDLLIKPNYLDFTSATVSIVIRTLNEEKYLDQLLLAIESQNTKNLGIEIIIVDSGSNDATLEIASKHNSRILHISREDFSFGRSLNIGCQAARGDALVIISGHCIPVTKDWLIKLCEPLLDGQANYVYGRQIGNDTSKFSETRIFAKYFPEVSAIPQQGFFCNNANAALSKSTWQEYKFNEDLTGLEDMELAKRLYQDGVQLAYLADAPVLHLHHESWEQIKRRFEREAIALQQIMPQVHVTYYDTARYIINSILGDLNEAHKDGIALSKLGEIIKYRYYQYTGSLKGNHQHRVLSHKEKEQYFFPY